MISTVLLSVIFLWSLSREARRVMSEPISAWTEDVSADCAVVLTGGPNRIREGLDLLSRRSVQKLIISGVNPQVEFHEINALGPYYGDLKAEDVILERRSRTTYGNAQQTLALVEALRCRDLILVTSRLHMYRAKRTFLAEFPQGYPLFSRAVVAGAVKPRTEELVSEALKSLFYSWWAY